MSSNSEKPFLSINLMTQLIKLTNHPTWVLQELSKTVAKITPSNISKEFETLEYKLCEQRRNYRNERDEVTTETNDYSIVKKLVESIRCAFLAS